MLKVGIVGWRGMVGSVLMDRMQREGDFAKIETRFFSTSQAGQKVPDLGQGQAGDGMGAVLQDANSVEAFSGLDVVLTCQGGDYTKQMFPQLRRAGWKGYWIDAASALRMDHDCVIVLDPVNREVIDRGLEQGIKKFIGGNCTVSLMLMALAGLLQKDLVEWVSAQTYQAASGGGARHVKELLQQMAVLGDCYRSCETESILSIDKKIGALLSGGQLPMDCFGAPLAGNLLPWIDGPVEQGRTREEWKAQAEGNKILGRELPMPIDGNCVRVGALRSHSQALTLKLRRPLQPADAEELLDGAHPWVQVVPNEKQATIAQLTPAHVSGGLNIKVGRVRNLSMGDDYLSLFTVGDQLLWGAAEPLRRMLQILVERHKLPKVERPKGYLT